jgi:hypothetical protein
VDCVELYLPDARKEKRYYTCLPSQGMFKWHQSGEIINTSLTSFNEKLYYESNTDL